jgi:tetratricopeptide (TPR) repeat protein
VTGRTVNVTGAKTPQGADEVFLKFEVLEWQSNPGTKTVDEKVSVVKRDPKTGKSYTTTETRQRTVNTTIGKALLGVTAADARGRALLAESEYQATGDGDGDSAAVAAAARSVVAKFLGDITPREVSATLRMDDDDKAQKPIIEVAKARNYPRAADEMRAYLAQNPNNPVAQYNLAVLLDAMGNYREALDLYTKAVQNSNKAFYAQAKAACATRLSNVEALSN